MSTTSLHRLLLLLAVVFLASIDQNSALPTSGKQEIKSISQIKHLKQQFDLFKRELEELLIDSSNDEPVVAGTQVDADSTADLEKRCAECEEEDTSSSSSSLEKRCPSGCGSKKKKKPQNTEAKVNEPATDLEKRCAECDEDTSSSSLEKRCPSGCGSKKKKTPPKRTECVDCHSGDGTQVESPMMKRFLNALPNEDRRLIEGSKAKRQYIERLIRRTNHGPNANDVAADKARADERVRAISNIGVRSMPAEDNGLMQSFKRSLSTSDQQLLQKYKSKTRFIEGVLEKQAANRDKRDFDVSGEKRRQFEDPVVSKYVGGLDEDQKALLKKHPSVAVHLKEAILKGNREGQTEKRELSPEQIKDVLSKLKSKEDADVVKQHLSKIEKVAEAETHPVGNPGEEVEQVVSRLMTDIKTAKKRGLSLERLFSAMKKKAFEHK